MKIFGFGFSLALRTFKHFFCLAFLCVWATDVKAAAGADTAEPHRASFSWSYCRNMIAFCRNSNRDCQSKYKCRITARKCH